MSIVTQKCGCSCGYFRKKDNKSKKYIRKFNVFPVCSFWFFVVMCTTQCCYQCACGPPTASPPKWARVCGGCPAGTHTCAAESRMTLQSERQLVRGVASVVWLSRVWTCGVFDRCRMTDKFSLQRIFQEVRIQNKVIIPMKKSFLISVLKRQNQN